MVKLQAHIKGAIRNRMISAIVANQIRAECRCTYLLPVTTECAAIQVLRCFVASHLRWRYAISSVKIDLVAELPYNLGSGM